MDQIIFRSVIKTLETVFPLAWVRYDPKYGVTATVKSKDASYGWQIHTMQVHVTPSTGGGGPLLARLVGLGPTGWKASHRDYDMEVDLVDLEGWVSWTYPLVIPSHYYEIVAWARLDGYVDLPKLSRLCWETGWDETPAESSLDNFWVIHPGQALAWGIDVEIVRPGDERNPTALLTRDKAPLSMSDSNALAKEIEAIAKGLLLDLGLESDPLDPLSHAC